MFSIDAFHRQYDTDVTEMVVNGRHFRFFVPRSIERFVDSEHPFDNFPLWAKLWEGAWVLADYLARLPVETDKRFLELGAGLGLVGIVAAAFGHRMTMTECDPHALAFARANAVANQCPQVDVLPLDWKAPKLDGTFDGIFGAEIVYSEAACRPLLKLFERSLKPDGEVVLALGPRKAASVFLDAAKVRYDIRLQPKRLRSGDQGVPVLLCRMRLKR